MRRSAISMVHQNMTDLGCTYPKPVEAEVAMAVGLKLGNASRKGGAASGMAAEGELRAEALAATVT